MNVDTGSDAEEENLSLWNKFLSESTRQTYEHGEATLIVCGEKSNPYGEIIHSMRSSGSRMGRPVPQLPYFFNYRWVAADGETGEAIDLHTWTVQDENHFEQVPTVVFDNHLANGRLAYVLCIDISKPNTIKAQLDKWVEFINKSQQLVLEKVGIKKMQELKDAVSRRIHLFQLDSTKEDLLPEDEKQAQDVDRDKPKINVGAQITVVMCKVEQLRKNVANTKISPQYIFQRILLYVRERSFEIGATIFSFANKRQGASIKRYIDSVVMDQKPTDKPHFANIPVQDLKDEQVFLPVGFDSEKNLANMLLKHRTSFEEKFKSKSKQKEWPKYDFNKDLKQRDDQAYLRSVANELEQNVKDRKLRRKIELVTKPKTETERRASLIRRRKSKNFKTVRRISKASRYNTLKLLKDRVPDNKSVLPR
jgi:hypothetical protein